jgi:hypothetical protein
MRERVSVTKSNCFMFLISSSSLIRPFTCRSRIPKQ